MGVVARIVQAFRCLSCGWESGGRCFVHEKDGTLVCPRCGGAGQRMGAQRFYGNRRFAETESVSLMEGFHPKEVREARRRMPEVQQCIKDDGRVEFSDRSEQRRFAAAMRRERPS